MLSRETKGDNAPVIIITTGRIRNKVKEQQSKWQCISNDVQTALRKRISKDVGKRRVVRNGTGRRPFDRDEEEEGEMERNEKERGGRNGRERSKKGKTSPERKG